MRFFCDEMLLRLGRWLRAAGHDTAIAHGGLADPVLIARCRAEERMLLTKDRSLAALARGRAAVMLLSGAGIEAEARELRRVLGLDWQAAPFTRCVLDNTPLDPAGEGDLARIPERARAIGGPIRLCPACRRLYWSGSHVRRMAARLAAWND
jgi:uncharacterized protein